MKNTCTTAIKIRKRDWNKGRKNNLMELYTKYYMKNENK